MAWSGHLILAAGSMLDHPAPTVLDAAAAAGFDAVGLRLSGEHAHDRPGELRRRADGVGLVVFDVEVHRIAAGAPDPRPLLDAAAAVGATRVLVVSDLDDRAATVDRLVEIRDECTSRQLRLGVEYMAWTMPHDPASAVSIADEVGCELVVDVLHHHRVGASPLDVERIVDAGRFGWLQLCDALLAPPRGRWPDALVDEARHGRRPPGHGELPLSDLLRGLPVDAPVSVEVQSDTLLALDPTVRARLLAGSARTLLDH